MIRFRILLFNIRNGKMKILLISILCIFLGNQLPGQVITGRIIDAVSGEPLIYAAIGVIETTRGTISDEQGKFSLAVNDIAANAVVRFSMIGYNPQSFTIEELINRENTIHLESKTFQLAELIVKPSGKQLKVGTESSTPGNLCGWGGTDTGKGYEIGTKLELGEKPVRLKSLHMLLHKQSFDKTLFRLHIRNLVDGMPGNEMLNTDVLISVDRESGWVEIDLSKYNLMFKGDIVLSLEWIKVLGLNDEKLMKMKGQSQYTANVLFKTNQKQGCMYTRWGTEATWSRFENKSPVFYLVVQ
jgi:hypothetical protein